jgi:bifunctional enzyme CysN/CysC/sulfate adenylyltransferase subunit 1
MLVWMSERPLDPKRSYFLKHTTRYVRAEIERVAHVVNLDTLEPEPAETLALNDIGSVTLSCLRPLYYDSYRESRTTGSFVLIDAITNDTVAAGMISGPASHAAPQADDRPSRVSAAERRERLGHAGAVIWLTAEIDLGYALERELFDLGVLAIVVELGAAAPAHTPELARRLADAGCVGIFSHAAPLSELRALVERSVGPNRFLEVSATNANEIAELAEKLDAALRSSQSRP